MMDEHTHAASEEAIRNTYRIEAASDLITSEAAEVRASIQRRQQNSLTPEETSGDSDKFNRITAELEHLYTDMHKIADSLTALRHST